MLAAGGSAPSSLSWLLAGGLHFFSHRPLQTASQDMASPKVSDPRMREHHDRSGTPLLPNITSNTLSLWPDAIGHTDQPWLSVGSDYTGCEYQKAELMGPSWRLP